MPPHISPVFSDYSRRSNQFWEHELVEFLCPQPREKEQALNAPLAFNSQRTVETPTGRYDFALTKSADGNTITLDATLNRGGQAYKTSLTAMKVGENLFEVRQLTFDNKIERIDSRWEMTKVMSHIGREQLQKACRDELPQAHEERGKFGKLARFADRWLLPENPFIIPPGI